MKFNLINPSDAYHFEAEDLEIAAVVVCIIGGGKYGADAIGEPHVPSGHEARSAPMRSYTYARVELVFRNRWTGLGCRVGRNGNGCLLRVRPVLPKRFEETLAGDTDL